MNEIKFAVAKFYILGRRWITHEFNCKCGNAACLSKNVKRALEENTAYAIEKKIPHSVSGTVTVEYGGSKTEMCWSVESQWGIPVVKVW